MNQLLGSDPAETLWQQVRPLLDDVMHELNEADRTAVVLRFFEGRSLNEVGLALGLTENAARMRVERSLEKLRSLLSQRGAKSTASTLTGVLAAGAVVTAPSTLAATVAKGALTAATSSSFTTFTLAKLLGLTKTKTAVAGALLGLVAAVITWQQFRSNRAATQQVTQEQVAVSDVTSVADDPSSQENSTIPVPAPTNVTALPQMILQIVETETGEPLPNAKRWRSAKLTHHVTA